MAIGTGEALSTPDKPHTVDLLIALRIAQGLTKAQAIAEVDALRRVVKSPRQAANHLPGMPLP